jgi:HK97 family phage major capsid protein
VFRANLLRGPSVAPKTLLGRTALGTPIYVVAGGARDTMEAWIPEEFDSQVIMRVNQISGVEALGSPVPMNSETRSVPRSAGVGVSIVAKGGTYAEDQSVNDSVILSASKFGQAVRIAEEDIDDSIADVIATKQKDWATSYGKMFDNACLATSAAPGTGVPFASVYYSLTQTDSGTGYVANSNLTQTGSGGTTYSTLSNSLGNVERGNYFDISEMVCLAHPAYRNLLRNIKDTNGRPIFQESTAGYPGGGMASSPDTIFGIAIHWSLGAMTSSVATPTPAGNPLLIWANRNYMIVGRRSGPESVFIDGRNGLSALTDESILKMRARRAFAVGHEAAFSVHEDNSGSLLT